MTRIAWGVASVAAAAGAITLRIVTRETPVASPTSTELVAATRASTLATSVHTTSTLCCAFTNVPDRNPRVGFYFEADPARQPSVYGLIFQRENDGTQADFGQDGNARPQWAMRIADNPTVLRSPEDTTAINLYAFDPRHAGTTWFEAGLRSIRYVNLGGRCRLSSA